MKGLVNRAWKKMALISLCASLVTVSVTGAFASVPVFVTNKENEHGELIQTILKNDWLKNVVYNLQDLKALQDLAEMASQAQDVMDNFDIQNLIGEMTQDLSGDFMDAVQEKLKGDGLEGGLGGSLSDILKGGLGGIGGGFKPPVLSDWGNVDLGDLLDTEGPVYTAKEASDRMREAANEAVRRTNDRAQKGGGLSGKPHKTHTPPPGFSEDKVFYKDGDKYYRDGKEYSKSEMEAIWRKEGGGVLHDSDGYHTWSTSGNKNSPAGQAQSKATGAVANYMKDVNTYNPMVLPGNQEAVAQASIEMTLGKTKNERNAFLLAMAQEQKNLALEGLAAIVAKYTDEEKSYQAAVNTSMEQYKDTLKKAQEISGKTAPGEALKAIAGLLAVQVEQLNNQNVLLLNMTDIMVDEIKVLDRLANLSIENYSNALYENLKERTSQFEAVRQQVRN